MLTVSDLESNLDVIGVLELWGVDTCDMRPASCDEWRSTCFIHSGDNVSSLSIRLRNGRWYIQCYSHGCYSGTLVDYGISLGRTFAQVMEDYARCQGESTPRKRSLQQHRPHGSSIYLPDTYMQRYERAVHQSYTTLGYDRDMLLDVFDVRFCNDPHDVMHGRVVYPIRDKLGRIVSVQGRRTNVCEPNATKYMFMPGYSAKHMLYGVWEHRHLIRQSRYIVLAESPKSSMRGYQLGIPTLATMGIKWTDAQIKLAASFGRRVICVADNDESGIGVNGMNDLAYELRRYVPVDVRVAPIPNSDISDFTTRNEWMKILEV